MKEIQVTLPGGETRAYPFGIKASVIAQALAPVQAPLAALLVNNEATALDERVIIDCAVEPLPVTDSRGAFIYRKSLCFLLSMAARELHPDRRLIAGMAIGNGFYHFFEDEERPTQAELRALEARMRALVEKDVSITLEWFGWAEAARYFEERKQLDTLLLLEHRNDSRIPLNECGGYRDLFITPLVPSTGILKTFELRPYHEGFLLRYPHKETPDRLEPFEDDPTLYAIADEYRRRGKIHGVRSIGALNRLATPQKMREFIRVAEALQNKKIAEIADRVAERADKVKVVLIAGPSSSGKTTTSKKLAVQLTVLGFRPVIIALDDYFVDRERTPRDEKGEYDFECLEALDVEYLNEQLVELFAGKEIELPTFDFKLGARRPSGRKLKLGPRDLLVMEGIHGLNDRLTPRIPKEQKFRIYVSALTQLNLDDHNRVSTTDNRLLRRMVRDWQFRGHSALDTLRMWPSVQRGERLHIFPFQNLADAAFNSALDYELGVLDVYAEPLLRTVKPVSPEYAEASRLLAFLGNIAPIPTHLVPRDSILREFIGESEFKY